MLKKKITISLLIFSIVLLIANIVIDKIESANSQPIVYEASSAKIDSIFWDILSAHGIIPDWVIKNSIRNENYDSLKHVFSVRIPDEIHIPIILTDIEYRFADRAYNLVVNEYSFNGKTSIKILSNNHLKFQSFFIPDNSIKRNSSRFSFIVKDGNEISDEELSTLTSLGLPLSIEFYPSDEAVNKIRLIAQYNSLEYSVILNDEIDQTKFLLSMSLGQNRIKGSIYSIQSVFAGAVLFSYDTHSELARSIGFNFIKNEFSKYDIALQPNNRYPDLSIISEEEAKSLFKFYHESGKGKEKKVFYISIDNLLTLNDQIKTYKKLGDRILPFTEK